MHVYKPMHVWGGWEEYEIMRVDLIKLRTLRELFSAQAVCKLEAVNKPQRKMKPSP